MALQICHTVALVVHLSIGLAIAQRVVLTVGLKTRKNIYNSRLIRVWQNECQNLRISPTYLLTQGYLNVANDS